MKNNTCVIANFNCTFNVNGKIIPLLKYFETIILPAMSDPSIMRITKKKKKILAEYFLYDVELIEVSPGELALVGKHVKRAFLRIDQDITPEGGIVPIGEIRPSAPFSTFILLLRNHRLIYFKNQDQGSPDIKSFGTTIREIVTLFIRSQRGNAVNELKKAKFIYDEKQYNTMKEFKEEVLDVILPYPQINIVPIESPKIVENKFNDISKIKELKVYIYNLNAENHYDDYFDSVGNFVEALEAEKIEQIAKNPKNIDEVKKMTSSSGGKLDYRIKGLSNSNEKIELTPYDVSESIPIKYSEESNEVVMAKDVYYEIKERPEISEDNSSDNRELYNSMFKGILCNKLE